jgi:hypothetical protein
MSFRSLALKSSFYPLVVLFWCQTAKTADIVNPFADKCRSISPKQEQTIMSQQKLQIVSLRIASGE